MALNPDNPRGPYRKKPIADRIDAWSIPVTETGCILWLGTVDPKGYGRIHAGRSGRLAHVVAYEDAIGPVPDGLVLDHKCRVRCCVNPLHLEPITQGVNVRRGNAGGDRRSVEFRATPKAVRPWH